MSKFDFFLAREQLVLAKTALQEAASLVDRDYKKIVELIEEEIRKIDKEVSREV